MQDRVNNFLLLRHLEESATQEELIKDGYYKVDKLSLVDEKYANSVAKAIKESEITSAVLVSSNSVRTKMTTRLLRKELKRKLDTTCDLTLRSDSRANTINHPELVTPLSSQNIHLFNQAKRVFVAEAFVNKNPFYRFGDSASNGKQEYPELQGLFQGGGECQLDMSIRLYELILDLIDERGGLVVLCTHLVVMSRFLALQSLAEKPIDETELLYLQEWDEGLIQLNGRNFHDYYEANDYTFNLDMNLISSLKPRLIKEINKLKEIKSNYGSY